MRCKGMVSSPQERKRYPGMMGDVQVNTQASEELRRSSNVARVSKGLLLEIRPIVTVIRRGLSWNGADRFCIEWY